MHWIELTAPNGSAVYINGESVIRVRASINGEAGHGARTVLELGGGGIQAVTEELAAVMAKMSAVGIGPS